MRKTALVLGAMLLCVAGCSNTEERPATEPVPGPTPTVQRLPIGDLPDPDMDEVLAHTKRLSSDDFEGRAPATKGEELTVAYLIGQLKKMGLEPGNTDDTYVQRVPLVGITPAPAPLIFRKGAAEQRLAWKDDVVAWTKQVADSASLDNSELVFVGYGVVAPEYNWDDYKGLDVRGKTLVMLVNDPPVPDPANGSELDPATFGGRAMTYYGRWTYKFDIAMEKGAAGALLIHETEAAGYPFNLVQAKASEQFDLVRPDKNMNRVAVEGWFTLEKARDLLRLAGQDFGALKSQAATREFRPVPLGVQASITINNTIRTLESRNVLARLSGRDPQLKNEYVLYSAHWDHLGIGPVVDGDGIYNGAKDNAVGVGGLLEIARAFKKLASPPKRTLVFLFATAEEQGLLGSEYYASSPVYPLARTVANINIDVLNVYGRTRDMTLIGYGASELDDYARDAAGEQGRIIRPDAEPETGQYYRSDHFSFARRGVPALDPDEGGVDFIGKPKGYGERLRAEFTRSRYHQPGDVVGPDWDLSGAFEDLKVLLAVGYRVAEAERRPHWNPGNDFKPERDASLQLRK